jgi:glycosyltransferase involved in cell wall biosynthesis
MRRNVPEKARILHLITRLPVGGAERMLVDVVRGLDPARYDSLVCCIQAKGELAADLEKSGTALVCLERMRSKRFDWRAVRELVRLLRAQRISLVHSHQYHANLYGRLAALIAGVPAVATVHNVYTRRKLHRRLLNRLLSRATARVVAVSEKVRHDLLAYDGIAPGKVVTIRNAIDLRRIETPLTRQEARARLDIPENALAIGCVGRLEEQKGHRYLLEACASLGKDIPLRIVLVGDGRLRKELESHAAALGIAPWTSFLGTRRDVAEILKALDVYAMPSLWEGLSVAMLEAMAAGLPLVVSDVSGVGEAFGDGECGIRVPPGEAPALAAAIRLLAGEPQRRRDLGLAAKQRVAAEFDVQVMTARLASVYEQALAGRPGR